MYTFLNSVGVILILGALTVVGRALFSWKGPLRGSLVLFFMGFVLLGFGFFFNLIGKTGSYDLETAFFALGIAMLVLGAEKMFTFTYSV